MNQYGETIYGTRGGDVAPHTWGVSTRKGDRLFIHILDLQDNALYIPLKAKVKKAIQIHFQNSTFFQTGERRHIYKTASST